MERYLIQCPFLGVSVKRDSTIREREREGKKVRRKEKKIDRRKEGKNEREKKRKGH